MKIANNVYKIKGEGNVYLYLGEEAFVIDTGSYREREEIKKGMEELIDLKLIKYVFLTHLHYDHSGNLNLFPNATIYSSKEEIEDYKEDPNNFFFGNLPKELIPFLDKIKPFPKKIKDLRIEEVPGHTRGSVYFVDEEKKLLFSGDTLFFNGVGRTDLKNSVPELMEASLKKLIKDLKTNNFELMPGHDY